MVRNMHRTYTIVGGQKRGVESVHLDAENEVFKLKVHGRTCIAGSEEMEDG